MIDRYLLNENFSNLSSTIPVKKLNKGINVIYNIFLMLFV